MRILTFLLLALGLGQPAIAAQNIPLDFVYRQDHSPDDGRTVIFQGLRTGQSLDTFCSPSSHRCSCLFMRHPSDPQPLRARPLYSPQYNNLRCEIPGSEDPDAFTLALLETQDRQFVSQRYGIRTNLTLKDVIGSLSTQKTRAIYHYSCTRTFFEGEGVSASQVSCPASQRLGLITAKYSYYLHNSQLGGNLHEKGANRAFESPICERQFDKLSCDGAPEARWGLYGEAVGAFQVAVTMTAAPEGTTGSSIYGFAALPDQRGNCPTGLVKIRPWTAQPQSIIQGSLDGTNPPSSFVNQNNNLNNTVVEGEQPLHFSVNRRPNQIPCEAAHTDPAPRPAPGSCMFAEFGAESQVQNVSYTPLTPVVCAIPKNLLPPM